MQQHFGNVFFIFYQGTQILKNMYRSEFNVCKKILFPKNVAEKNHSLQTAGRQAGICKKIILETKIIPKFCTFANYQKPAFSI